MADAARTPFVWVKRKAGDEFICPASSLKDAQNASKDQLNIASMTQQVHAHAGG